MEGARALRATWLEVTLRDMPVGDAVTAVTEAGANVMSGPDLRISDRESANKSAYAAAYRAARSRAEAYAGAAGLKIDRVLAIRDGGESGTVTMDARYGMEMAAQSAAPVSPPPAHQRRAQQHRGRGPSGLCLLANDQAKRASAEGLIGSMTSRRRVSCCGRRHSCRGGSAAPASNSASAAHGGRCLRPNPVPKALAVRVVRSAIRLAVGHCGSARQLRRAGRQNPPTPESRRQSARRRGPSGPIRHKSSAPLISRPGSCRRNNCISHYARERGRGTESASCQDR